MTTTISEPETAKRDAPGQGSFRSESGADSVTSLETVVELHCGHLTNEIQILLADTDMQRQMS